MKLVKGKTYTAPNTVLRAKVITIFHYSEKYTKAKILLTTPGHIVEMKTYKLYHNRIQHWEEVCSTS